MSLDNSPNVGQFGPAELDKERRWHEERQRCALLFRRAFAYLLSLADGPRRSELDRYRRAEGELQGQTMEAYLKSKVEGHAG